MENLINFDDDFDAPQKPNSGCNCLPVANTVPLLPSRTSIELIPDPSNPYETAEEAAAGDPYECSKFNQNNSSLHLTDGDAFSFDCFQSVTNISSIHSSSIDTTISSQGSGKTVVGRSFSDSSTISVKSENTPTSVNNRSLDSVAPTKPNQLLKLSLLNSQNSVDTSVDSEKISKKFADFGQMSFEDLNNVTQELVDASNDSIIIEDDLKNLKVNVFGSDLKPPATPSAKIAEFQEKLNKIKKEVDWDEVIDLSVDVKEEFVSPKPVKTEKSDDKSSELDAIYSKFKTVLTEGNKDEAKKQLARLSEMLGSEPKSTLTVQPFVRQATFDIDEKTGEKKVSNLKNTPEVTVPPQNDDLMEKLAEIFRTQALDVRSMDNSGTKIVVVVPGLSSTPQKQPSILNIRHKSAFKASEAKKFTPMKPHATSLRPSTGLSKTAVKPPNPYEQKLAGPPHVGSVRKSLLASIDSPQVPLKRPVAARRSVSMKASIPQVQVTKTSPVKNVTPRPSVGTPRPSSFTPRGSLTASAPKTALASSKRLSSVTFVKPGPAKPVTAKSSLAGKPATASKSTTAGNPPKTGNSSTTLKTRPTTRQSSQFKVPATVRKTTAVKESSLV